MKRIAVILLILIYSASVYGITVNKFYCCGKLSSISLSADHQSKSDDAKAVGSACCKIIKESFKVKDNHFSAKTALTLNGPFALIAPVFFIPNAPERITLIKVIAYDSQAPPVQRNPLYILYANYRI